MSNLKTTRRNANKMSSYNRSKLMYSFLRQSQRSCRVTRLTRQTVCNRVVPIIALLTLETSVSRDQRSGSRWLKFKILRPLQRRTILLQPTIRVDILLLLHLMKDQSTFNLLYYISQIMSRP